jgi:hypothetical protein
MKLKLLLRWWTILNELILLILLIIWRVNGVIRLISIIFKVYVIGAMPKNQERKVMEDRVEYKVINEKVDHPAHYNQYPMEVIDMMEMIWVKKATVLYCKMNAFKYRMRMGYKDDLEQDFKKEQWYLKKAKELAI